MDQIIERLFVIEAAAVKIMEDTLEKKRDLSEGFEDKILEFDKKLKTDTLKKLEMYNMELNQQFDEKVKHFEEHTNEIKQLMEAVYESHHTEIAEKLLISVIKE